MLYPWVIGIDASTVSVAFVAGRDDTEVFYRKVKLKPVPERPYNAFMATRSFVRKVSSLPQAEVRFAMIESPLMNKQNVQTAIKQSIVNGAIQAALSSLHVPFELIQPSSWKKRALGKGNLDKDNIRKAIRSDWPEIAADIGDDQDLNDAFGIYMAGLDVFLRSEAFVVQAQEAT